jgi:hypothetical protein
MTSFGSCLNSVETRRSSTRIFDQLRVLLLEGVAHDERVEDHEPGLARRGRRS